MPLIPFGSIPAMQADRLGADAWAMRYDDDILTWGELDDRSSRRAWAYRELGVASGDMVTLGAPNGIAFYECMFGLWKIGATPHVVSWRLPQAELAAIVALAGSRLLIMDDAPPVPGPIVKPVSFGADFPKTAPHAAIVAKPWKAMSSGGSTGRPKIIAAVAPGSFDPAGPGWLNLPANGTVLFAGPVYHNMPMTTNLRALFQGLNVVGMSKFDPEEALRLIDRHKIKWTSFVPTMMNRISKLPRDVREGYDVSSLESVWHWAAPMPPTLKEEWIAWLGASRIWELYGGTEGIGTTVINGVDWLSHKGSVGRPVSDKLRILDDNGDEVPAGCVGEIFALPVGGRGSTYRYIGADARSAADGYETLVACVLAIDDNF